MRPDPDLSSSQRELQMIATPLTESELSNYWSVISSGPCELETMYTHNEAPVASKREGSPRGFIPGTLSE
jgi:hypothetical protein